MIRRIQKNVPPPLLSYCREKRSSDGFDGWLSFPFGHCCAQKQSPSSCPKPIRPAHWAQASISIQEKKYLPNTASIYTIWTVTPTNMDVLFKTFSVKKCFGSKEAKIMVRYEIPHVKKNQECVFWKKTFQASLSSSFPFPTNSNLVSAKAVKGNPPQKKISCFSFPWLPSGGGFVRFPCSDMWGFAVVVVVPHVKINWKKHTPKRDGLVKSEFQISWNFYFVTHGYGEETLVSNLVFTAPQCF